MKTVCSAVPDCGVILNTPPTGGEFIVTDTEQVDDVVRSSDFPTIVREKENVPPADRYPGDNTR